MNLVIAVVLFGVVLSGFGVQQLSTTIGSVNACLLPATSERQSCESSRLRNRNGSLSHEQNLP